MVNFYQGGIRMSNYTQPAKDLLEHIGGSENISVVTHCVTRMRFVLKDPKKADIDQIESIKLVKGTFTQAGQFQVIIGNEVSSFYNEFIKIAGVSDTSKEDAKLAAKQNMNWLQRMIALSNIAQGSAVLAMIYINRKNEEEKQVSIPAAISCYLGVTEPAMFGINLKYGFPFLAAMIGSLVAAVISVGSNVMANSIGVGGLPGILSIQPQHMLTFAIAMIVAIVVPFILTVVFAKMNIGKVSFKRK